jgi:CRP-like cAMP-binding protein
MRRRCGYWCRVPAWLGMAWRMGAPRFRRALKEQPLFRCRLQRHLYAVKGKLAQAAACTRYHRLEARLARWSLMTRDRAYLTRFYVTHTGSLASMWRLPVRG